MINNHDFLLLLIFLILLYMCRKHTYEAYANSGLSLDCLVKYFIKENEALTNKVIKTTDNTDALREIVEKNYKMKPDCKS